MTDVAEPSPDAAPDPEPVPVQREATAALAAYEPAAGLIPVGVEFQELASLAVVLANSQLVPRALREKPNDVLLVLLTARDLGIAPTTALRKCYPIDGQVSIAPALKIALVEIQGKGSVRPPGKYLPGVTGDDGEPIPDPDFPNNRTRATAIALDPRGHEIGRLTLTMADMESVQFTVWKNNHPTSSKLIDKDNWKNYPQRMLWWRCLPSRAQALSIEHGWVDKDKVHEGMRILAFDKTTGTTRWSRVTNVVEFDHQQTHRIESGTFAATATADHRWVVDHARSPDQWAMRETSDLDTGQHRVLVAAPFTNEPDVDWSLIGSEDAARIGWFLTDGTVQWRGNSPTITISQSKHTAAVRAAFPDADETVIPARDRTLRGQVVHTGPETRWRLSARESRRLLAWFGLHDKESCDHVPALLDTAGRRAMFDAMNLANGSRNGAGWNFRTGHQSVLDCYMALATLLGIRCGRPTFAKGCWSVSTSPDRPRVAAKRLSITPATVESVWCPTTEDDTWVARIDGQVTITGNCAGYVVDDWFPSVALGLYSPDELGGMIGEDGEVLDLDSVETPAGMTRKQQRRSGPRAGSDEPPEMFSPEDAAAFRARTATWPGAARAELVRLLGEAGYARSDFPEKIPARRIRSVTAMVDGVERRAAAGEWGDWSVPAAGEPDDGITEAEILCDTCAENPCVCDADHGPTPDPDAEYQPGEEPFDEGSPMAAQSPHTEPASPAPTEPDSEPSTDDPGPDPAVPGALTLAEVIEWGRSTIISRSQALGMTGLNPRDKVKDLASNYLAEWQHQNT